ncbi:MAG: 1-deoxy-D-xylulose-5-phosphate synthase [Defluviitaleaceae bacterium]|nr:1-deoxy-D-xylulose-5-phosphate synthase [Defluviitaleaceae bacterium]
MTKNIQKNIKNMNTMNIAVPSATPVTLADIQSPQDIKQLTVAELTAIAAEIRQFLVRNIAKTGGHLASNLGVVELTLALHKVFDTPTDKIIWDVGHQSYVHKILTGRQQDFKRLRKLDGLSGFPKSRESAHDAFDTGHSSTAISAALGFCTARDISNQNHHVAAIVGDGSMTGGLVYEALNNAGRSGTNLLVVLNDNQMSIAENVGAISRHLNDIRTTPIYRDVKKDVHKILQAVPLGKKIDKTIEKIKDAVKYTVVPGILFEELGFQYFGPIDGHDIKLLLKTLQKLQKIKGPVLLHVVTKKGKGYKLAEKAPDTFHGVDAFSVKSGRTLNSHNKPLATYTDIFGDTIVKLAQKEPKLVAITAAMPGGTGLDKFRQTFPDRLFDVGIAESHAVTFAAGMAKCGVIPIVSIYSSFLQRAYDQILHDVCVQNLHVIFAVDRAGIVGADGETHQGLFDISYLSHMPNMTVIAPKNRLEFQEMLRFAAFSHKAPIAIRYPKGTASEILPDYAAPLTYGEPEIILKGENIAVVSVGTMMDTAYNAVQNLIQSGYNPSLYNARFINGYKSTKYLHDYSFVFILEDSVKSGGYGEKLSAAATNEYFMCLNDQNGQNSQNGYNKPKNERPPQFHTLAFPDKFIEQGTRAELFKRYELDEEGVTKRILNLIGLSTN